jgi:hypothetical protein
MEKKWILSFDENGFKVTRGFVTLDAMFEFIETAALARFKAKRVG